MEGMRLVVDDADTKEDKCYCLEAFREKYGPHVQGECLKLSCANYRKHNPDQTGSRECE